MIASRVAVLALALAALSSAPPAAAATLFAVNLTADQEVPPTTAAGSGSGRLQLLGDALTGFSLAYQLRISPDYNFGLPDPTNPLSVTAFHIHNAPRGVNGPVVYGLLSPNSNLDADPTITQLADGWWKVTGSWDEGEGAGAGLVQIGDFAASVAGLAVGDDTDFYFNLHTIDFPAGAIRGQIAVVPLPATGLLLIGGLLVLARLRRSA